MVRILLIEDDPDIRTDLSEILQDEGHEVTTAENGIEGLLILRGGPRPDLILLDLMMPIMDGWEFRAEQLRDSSFRTVPVVILSGAANIAREATDLSASGHVGKPIRLELLLDIISRHLT
jgi:CheY-like chemotaxis protein